MLLVRYSLIQCKIVEFKNLSFHLRYCLLPMPTMVTYAKRHKQYTCIVCHTFMHTCHKFSTTEDSDAVILKKNRLQDYFF